MWIHDTAYFCGGAFAANAIPHLTLGLSGRPFQSPFASPPGRGLSSSTVNVVWGWFNLIIFYVLVCRVGSFDLRSLPDAISFAVGFLLAGVWLARNFGKLHGGNTPSGA